MTYADIMWKLVEQILNEKDTDKLANDQCNKKQTED